LAVIFVFAYQSIKQLILSNHLHPFFIFGLFFFSIPVVPQELKKTLTKSEQKDKLAQFDHAESRRIKAENNDLEACSRLFFLA
jgi:hypothetical protein